MFHKSIITLLLLFFITDSFAQDKPAVVRDIFRGTRVVNGHSVETMGHGELEFLISHRFGSLNQGFYDLFGLDNAQIRFGLEYGITDWLNVGVGRSSAGKTYDGFLKARILRQRESGFSPISITGFSSIAVKTLNPADTALIPPFQDRLSFTNQLLIARKFNDRISLQIMPTHVHYNLVDTRTESNDVFALGTALKVQITKNLATTLEYYYRFPGQLEGEKYNSFTVGFDINTGNHVFQLHLTNSTGMIEKSFIGETSERWQDGGIKIGFNIGRTFKVKGRRY